MPAAARYSGKGWKVVEISSFVASISSVTAITEFTGAAPAVGSVDPTLYRDDLRRRPARALGETDVPDGGLDDTADDRRI